MVKDKAFWVFIGIILCVAALCGALAVVYHDRLAFDPVSAINEGLDFIVGLLSMIISFWVAEIYWKNKTEREQAARVLDQLRYHLDYVVEIVAETRQDLSDVARGGDDPVRLEREVLANLRRLGDANRNTLRIIDVSSLELKRDQHAARASARYRRDVAPVVDKLSRRSYVRPEVKEIESRLVSLGEDIDQILRGLKGELSNESNSPWGSN